MSYLFTSSEYLRAVVQPEAAQLWAFNFLSNAFLHASNHSAEDILHNCKDAVTSEMSSETLVLACHLRSLDFHFHSTF